MIMAGFNHYSTHEVAKIIAEIVGDNCACNINGNDEWLPEKCELADSCTDVVGVTCWEQYLRYCKPVKNCKWCGREITEGKEFCEPCDTSYAEGYLNGRNGMLELAKEQYREYDLKIARLEGKIELLKEQALNIGSRFKET